MSTRKKQPGIEWAGGLVSMPAYVTGEGAPYRPEMLLWMSEGAVLGHGLGKPGEMINQACASLRATIERPIYGRPHRPDRIRVASESLAEVLRAGYPGLEIVCGPTPELDDVFAAMREDLNQDAEPDQSYLSGDVTPATVAAFFRAAAALFRTQPWKIVPSDQCTFAITIEALGVKDMVLSVIGQLGQSLGLILFPGIDEFEAHLDAAEMAALGETPPIPPHVSINFERGTELTTSLRKEIAEHHWEVAGPAAYPWLLAVDDDQISRPPSAKDLTIAEAIACALPKMLEDAKDTKALLVAWCGGPPVARTLKVPTHGGEVEVAIRVPCAPPVEAKPPKRGAPAKRQGRRSSAR